VSVIMVREEDSEDALNLWTDEATGWLCS
jgi:hypothetical protein